MEARFFLLLNNNDEGNMNCYNEVSRVYHKMNVYLRPCKDCCCPVVLGCCVCWMLLWIKSMKICFTYLHPPVTVCHVCWWMLVSSWCRVSLLYNSTFIAHLLETQSPATLPSPSHHTCSVGNQALPPQPTLHRHRIKSYVCAKMQH